jgi:predicted enzyme related to lactoylglutathione lyase
MSTEPIAAILIHVGDVKAGLDWYQRAFPDAVRCRVEGTDFEYLTIGNAQIELVPADAKVGSGAAGSVVYWRAPAFEETLARLLSMGAELYRGPMDIENGLKMAQVRDPWGNCIGLRGASTARP